MPWAGLKDTGRQPIESEPVPCACPLCCPLFFLFQFPVSGRAEMCQERTCPLLLSPPSERLSPSPKGDHGQGRLDSDFVREGRSSKRLVSAGASHLTLPRGSVTAVVRSPVILKPAMNSRPELRRLKDFRRWQFIARVSPEEECDPK